VRYVVEAPVRVRVHAKDRDAAVVVAVRAVMGPWWQHCWPLRLLPWRWQAVRAMGGFQVEEDV